MVKVCDLTPLSERCRLSPLLIHCGWVSTSQEMSSWLWMTTMYCVVYCVIIVCSHVSSLPLKLVLRFLVMISHLAHYQCVVCWFVVHFLGICPSEELGCWGKPLHWQSRPRSRWEIALWYVQCIRRDPTNTEDNAWPGNGQQQRFCVHQLCEFWCLGCCNGGYEWTVPVQSCYYDIICIQEGF